MKISVIGIGPGEKEQMTFKALEAIKNADVIVGYKTYIDLVSELITDKEVVQNGMKREIDRCEEAVRRYRLGENVAVISSGDPGVYGMAGLVMELVNETEADDVEIIPGVSASCSCASILGAPLMHDFATISLSDLLTPWELIQKRVKLAAEGDFVIAIYNPKSKGRPHHLQTVQEILLTVRDKATPVGIVNKAGREGQSDVITTLENLHLADVNMFSTVIVGNSHTFVKGNRMVTPRGYKV